MDRVFRAMTRLGIGGSYRSVLSVRGRRSGVVRSTPLGAIVSGEDRWLVAAYGEVSWVRNVQAAGEASLSRGGRTEAFRGIEASPSEAVPVLREYIQRIRVARPYFDAMPDSWDAELEAELPRHAVFRLVALTPAEAGAG